MIRIEYGGRRLRPSDMADHLEGAALQMIVDSVRTKIEGIRDPNTGETPTVVIRATSLSDIKIDVEGSDTLLEIVRLRFSDELEEDVEVAIDERKPVKVFFSWASEDRELAGRLANGLQAAGVAVWWSEWEIRTGDSIRQRIDEGLGECTHFLVLLTPTSVTKPWVNAELDAGFVLAMESRVRLLPIRYQLSTADMPGLTRGRLAPALDDFDACLRTLVGDILELNRRPPVGAPPPATSSPRSATFSPAATAVAGEFVRATVNATGLEPQRTRQQLMESTGLSTEDVSDAIHELGSRIHEHRYSGGSTIVARPSLYADFDPLFQPWDPAEDALLLAADMVSDPAYPRSPEQIAARYEWPPRRLNPAIAYLQDRDAVDVMSTISDGRFLGHRVTATDATRRFVKSRRIAVKAP